MQEIMNIFGEQFPIISEDEQRDAKYHLYLWAEELNGVQYVKFGETFKMTVYTRYNDAGDKHHRIIRMWETDLHDKPIHKYLQSIMDKYDFKWAGEKQVCPLKSEECYIIASLQGLHDLINLIDEVVANGVVPNTNVATKTGDALFEPRNNQIVCVDKITNYLKEADNKKFLIWAVCRFGKCATTLYSCIEKLKMKKILILSSMCDTKESWYADWNKWSFTIGYSFIKKEYIMDNPNILDGKDKMIAWCSFQSTAKNFEQNCVDDFENIDFDEETWQNTITKYDWDILITDECHYGVETIRSERLIQTILNNNKNCKHISISATPFKMINRGDFDISNTFRYTLIDEHDDFVNGKIAKKDYVPVELYHIDLKKHWETEGIPQYTHSTITKKNLTENIEKCMDDENKFSFDSYFNYFKAVEIGTEFELLYDNIFSKNDKNALVYVKKIEQGNKLEKGIDHDRFNVFNLCGNNKISLDTINQAIELDEKPNIIISCGRFFTGVTIPKLHNQIFMGKINSAERYIQYGLRGKNSYRGRKNPCRIYDLNPESFVSTDSFKDLIFTLARTSNDSNNTILKKWEDSVDMLEWDNGDIFTKYNNFVNDFENNICHFSNDTYIPYFNFDNDILYGLNEYISHLKLAKSKQNITEQQIAKANLITIDNTEDDKPKNKALKLDSLNKIKSKLKECIKIIPPFLKYNNITSLDELINNEENIKKFHYWGLSSDKKDSVDTEFLLYLNRELPKWKWDDFAKNIMKVTELLPNNREEWKYDCSSTDWM